MLCGFYDNFIYNLLYYDWEINIKSMRVSTYLRICAVVMSPYDDCIVLKFLQKDPNVTSWDHEDFFSTH